MTSLKDVRRRMNSVKNTQKVTKAIEAIAAARLKRAQEKTVISYPYGVSVYNSIQTIVSNLDPSFEHPFLGSIKPNKVAIIIVSSDKGLAGTYNSNLFKEVWRQISNTEEMIAKANFQICKVKFKRRTLRLQSILQQRIKKLRGGEFLSAVKSQFSDPQRLADIYLFTVGRKSSSYFKKYKYPILKEYTGFSEKPNFKHAQEITDNIIEGYLHLLYDEIYLITTRFITPIKTYPITMRLLPIVPIGEQIKCNELLFTPNVNEVLDYLLPRYVEVLIYTALTQSAASELGSRMTAMDNASENAKEMIDKLVLSYNKLRQAAITREISEIVGGAEALQ